MILALALLAAVPDVEIRTSSAAPLVVALHGLGDRPEAFAPLFRGLPNVLVLGAPIPWGDGGAWFTARVAERDEAALAAQLAAAADRLAERIRGRADRVIVTGFSQGGMLSLALAARHPDLVVAAIAVGGWLPPSIRAKRAGPRVFILHGEEDRVVPLGPTRESARALGRAGIAVELSVYPRLGHTVSRALHADWLRRLVEESRRAAKDVRVRADTPGERPVIPRWPVR